MTYYNRPSATETALNKEVTEFDWINVLMPRSYVACAALAFSGTILSQMRSSTLLRSIGQSLQLLAMGSLVRIMGSVYDTSNSGKGI